MRIDINAEEYMSNKLKKYISQVTTVLVIYVLYITYKLLIQTSHPGFWFLGLILFVIFSIIYVYISSKNAANKQPYVIIQDDEIMCNFKQVPTKSGSFKNKFLESFESVEEDCYMNVVTHYELTKKHIIAYGYSNENLRELTGFVIERFFDEDDEILIVNWLQSHISNIHDSKTQYIIR